jgi:hypothetical protein
LEYPARYLEDADLDRGITTHPSLRVRPARYVSNNSCTYMSGDTIRLHVKFSAMDIDQFSSDKGDYVQELMLAPRSRTSIYV